MTPSAPPARTPTRRGHVLYDGQCPLCLKSVGVLKRLDWFGRLRAATTHELTAAGGITTIEDIRALDALGIHAAIGMALYTGRLDLGAISPPALP